MYLRSATNEYFYQHLGSIAAGITLNRKVTRGTVLGTLWSFPSNTPHLHFAARDNQDGYPDSRTALPNFLDKCEG